MELNPFAYKIDPDMSLSIISDASTNHIRWINDRLNLLLDLEKQNKIKYNEDGIFIAIEDVDFPGYYNLKWMKQSDIKLSSLDENDIDLISSKISNEKPIIAFISIIDHYYMIYQVDFDQITKYITLKLLSDDVCFNNILN